MLEGYATKEGTNRFAKRFQTNRDDFYKNLFDLTISSVGVGSYMPEPYREESYIPSYKDSIKRAIELGVNFIDTAINYRYQKSEKEIGEALSELEFGRDELFIASKGGFLPLNYPFPPNPYKWIDEEIVESRLANRDEIELDEHCLNPKFIEWSLKKSLNNLGIETLDIYYLHNPEVQLGRVEYPKLLELIEENFKMLEESVERGDIRYYGIASWNGFLYEDTNREYLSLLDFFKVAKKVGGEKHHFRFLQIPFNLAKPHAYAYTNQQLEDGLFYSLFQAASALNIKVVTSSSFLRMNIFKKPFNEKVRALLGVEAMSDIHRALQFARSSDFVLSSLFSSTKVENVEHNLEIREMQKCSKQNFAKIFKL